MDCRLSVRVAYYTGWLRPDMEGTSREVFALAQYFGAKYILGFSQHESVRIIWKKRALGLNQKTYLILKLLISFLERTQHLSHIYDNIGCWHYLRNLGRKPIILTATSGSKPLPIHFYDKVAALVVDSESRYNELTQLGFPSQKLKIIYPGIDIDYFKPTQCLPSSKPFKVMFASAPPTVEELPGRGVWQILDAAQLLPDVEFTIIWRPWGDSLQFVKKRIKDQRLSNITLMDQLIPDMRSLYHQVHCVLAPFKKDGGKSCPTSILESCACGLPVIVGTGVGIRGLLIKEGAGLDAGKGGNELAEALQSVQQSWDSMRIRARKLAERFFSSSQFFNNYKILYQQVVDSKGFK